MILNKIKNLSCDTQHADSFLIILWIGEHLQLHFLRGTQQQFSENVCSENGLDCGLNLTVKTVAEVN